jgi:hypothetical protein
MSIDQLLFLVLDALITTLLVAMVLRRRRNEAGAADKLPATAPTDELRTTTTTLKLSTPTANGTPGAMSASRPPYNPASPNAHAAPPAPRPVIVPATPPVPRAAGVPALPGEPEATPETGSLTRLFGRGQLRGLATFAAEQNERIGAYVRDNWHGVPGALPAVLDALLTELEQDAEAKGLWLDRETLKSMLVVALRSNRVVDSDVVLEALEKVA